EDEQVQKLSTTVSDYLDNGADNTKFKMKDTLTYAFMSDYILPSGDATENKTKYIPFNNYYFMNSSGTVAKSLEYSKINANDYSISTVRAYLNGKTIYTECQEQRTTLNGDAVYNYTPNTTGVTANFFTQNGLKGEDIYTLIQPRTLTSLYNNISDDTNHQIILDTSNAEGISGEDSDSFWLMSYAEAQLFKQENVPGFPKLMGKLPTSSTVNAADWFFRSPEYSIPFHGRYIRGEDGLPPNFSVCGAYGVRPCFLI
ncbi:MAG: DUF6273 domain-containing protein, partial [Eubacteriales bacterium]|nr:DUF6273 domain-containing protein [Eubacteriales bacterium]